MQQLCSSGVSGVARFVDTSRSHSLRSTAYAYALGLRLFGRALTCLAAVSGLTIPNWLEQSRRIRKPLRARMREMSVEGDKIDGGGAAGCAPSGYGKCWWSTSYTVKVTANWGDERITRARPPLYSALTPSSFRIVWIPFIKPV